MDELSELRARIDALEVKTEVTGIIVTGLLAAVPDLKQYLDDVEVAIELHDANALYATSLSDDQRQRVLLNLQGFVNALRRGRHDT
jgi:hypothetical protein